MATCGFLASRQRLECADSSRRFSQRCELQWRKKYRREHMRRFDSGAWERRTPYASRGIDAWAWVGPIVDGNLWVLASRQRLECADSRRRFCEELRKHADIVGRGQFCEAALGSAALQTLREVLNPR